MRPHLSPCPPGITRQLFLDGAPTTLSSYLAYDTQEFLGQWPLAPETRAALRRALDNREEGPTPTTAPTTPATVSPAAASHTCCAKEAGGEGGALRAGVEA